MTTNPRTIVCVPTYDEAENLPALAEQLLALVPEVDVLVVDDDSPDGTGEIADAVAAECGRMHVMHRREGRGYAPACRAGLAWCLERDYEFVVTMDADLSHDPHVIPSLVETAVDRDADLVVGSRYAPGGGLEVDWGWFRRAVSRSGSRYARLMIGTPVRDCTSGFRCYRASSLRQAHVERTTSSGYFFCIEALSRVIDAGGTVREFPITYVDRQLGRSKISNGIVYEAFWLTTLLGLRRLTGRRRGAGSRPRR
jgi:dolichol-phosphate mannosyltransferase